MRAGGDIRIVVILLLVLVVAGFFLSSPNSGAESKVSTSYNADPMGVKAFFTLLDRLGYRVERLHKPYASLGQRESVLFIVRPTSKIGRADYDRLRRWVERGGTAVFVTDRLAEAPSELRRSRGLGKGRVYAFDKRLRITNEAMRDARNAERLVRVVERHAGRGVVVFDEYHHGLRNDGSMLTLVGPRVRVAALALLAAGVVLCHTMGKRFGAVRDLPRRETARGDSEFVEAVARLYGRSRATDVAARVLCESFRLGLAGKLGASPVDSELMEAVRVDIPTFEERVSSVLRACNAGDKPTERELVGIAGEIAALEEEMGIGRV